MYDHIQAGMQVKCPFENCRNITVFHSVSALKRHFYRLHYTAIKYGKRDKNQKLCEDSSHNNPEKKDGNVTCETVQFFTDTAIVEEQVNLSKLFSEVYIKSLASAYLTLQAKYFMTETTLQLMTANLANLNDLTLINNLK